MSRETAETTRMSRRSYLAGGATAVTAAVAGCTEGAINWIVNKVLEEVNVLAEDSIEASGTVTVVSPDGETRLDTEFTAGGDGETESTYDDVWTSTGTYEVSVQLDEPLFDTQEKSGSVTITNTDDDRLFVLLGNDEFDQEITFRVGEELTDVVSDE